MRSRRSISPTTLDVGTPPVNQHEIENAQIPAADPEVATSISPTEESSDWRFRGVNPMIRKAMEKHRREWEGLMKRHAYQWAAYHGDVRLEVGKTKHELYSKYLKRGIKKEELVVLGIGPPLEDEYER
jgi:hypothetical protein